MRRAVLLYNPHAGRRRACGEVLQAVAAALRAGNIEATAVPTAGPGTAGMQAREAAARCEIVFACGGDGTVHEVVQGLAGQTATALGVLPMGSANVLARHLRLPMDPVRAAAEQMRRASIVIPLGRMSYQGRHSQESRLFVSVAGAGADGMLAQQTGSFGKGRMGRWAYPYHAGKLCLGASLSPFEVCGTSSGGTGMTALALSAMCSRVRSLGGLLRPMVAAGSLEDAALRVTLLQGRSWLTFPGWFASSWMGITKHFRSRSLHDLTTLHCGAGLTGPVYVQADGEFLGRTPMSLEMAPEGLRLLAA